MFRRKCLSPLLFTCSVLGTIVIFCITNFPTQKVGATNPSSPANKSSSGTIYKTATKNPSGVIEVSTGVEPLDAFAAVLPSEISITIVSLQKNRTQINPPVQGWLNLNQVAQASKSQLTKQQVEELLKQAVDQTVSGDYKDAIQTFTEIISSQPDRAEPYYRRGIAYLNLYLREQNLSYFNAAFKDFNQATQLNPRAATAFLYKGATHSSKSGPSLRYKDLTEAIRLNPNLAEAYYYRAFVQVGERGIDLDKSISDLNEAIRLNPNFAEAYYLRFNRSLSSTHSDLSTSNLKDLVQALRLDPQFTEKFHTNVDLSGFYLLGRQPYPQLLLDKLNQRIQANPNDIDAYFGRGTLKLELADRRGAIADFTQVIQANSQDADAYYRRGLARYRIKDYKGAVADMRQALKLDSKMQEPYAMLSLVYYDMGKKSEALENAAQAIKLKDKQIIPYLVQGLIYEEQGKTIQAKASFARFIDYLPEIGAGGGASKAELDRQVCKANAESLFNQGRRQEAKKQLARC